MSPPDCSVKLAKLQRSKKAIGTLTTTLVAMLVLLLALLFIKDTTTVYTIGIFVLLYSILVVRPAKKRYLEDFSEAIALSYVSDVLEEPRYIRKAALPKNILEAAKLISPRMWPSDAICRHKIHGAAHGADIEVCECSFGVKHGPRHGDVAFLSGICIRIQLSASSPLSISCMSQEIPHVSDAAPDLSAYNLKRAPFKSAPSVQPVYLFTPDGQPVPDRIKRCLTIVFAFEQPIMLSFHNNQLFLLSLSRFYVPRPRLSTPVNQETLSANHLPELDAALALIQMIQRTAVS